MGETTIKDVARRAGVSVATVSRVINNSNNVRSETVSRVHEAIEAVRYIPNIAARNLKTDSSNLVAFLISNIANNHFTTMAKVIDANLRKAGYSLMVCSTEDDPSLELQYLKRVQSQNVAGVILNTTGKNDGYVCELSKTIPIALVDRSVGSPDFVGDFVGSNGRGGVYMLTEHLIKQGHRKIAILTSDLSTSTGRERLAGFTEAMQKIGVTVDDHYPYSYNSGHFNEEGGIAGCKFLMSLPDPPTAIVVANNDMAIGAYRYLHNSGYSVPEDVSVVSFGNIRYSDLFRIQPTFVTLNPAFIAEKASGMLLSRIENPGIGYREVIFEPLLKINSSTREV